MGLVSACALWQSRHEDSNTILARSPPSPSFVVPFFVCPPVCLEYVVLRQDSPAWQAVLGVIVSWVLSFFFLFSSFGPREARVTPRRFLLLLHPGWVRGAVWETGKRDKGGQMQPQLGIWKRFIRVVVIVLAINH